LNKPNFKCLEEEKTQNLAKKLGILEGEKSRNLRRRKISESQRKISKSQKKRNLGILGEEKSQNLRRRKILGI
jgi:hypothetical protein